MKSTIVFLLICSVTINAQTSKIWKGDVYAKDLDTFLQGEYSIIEGNLEIYKTTLTNLAPLKFLKVVKGNVHIGIYDYKRDLEEGNESLLSLEGLENLTEISGELEIRDNKLLENIEALKSLKKVNQLNVSYNPMLSSLEGLNNVSGTLPEGLQLYKNKRLQDITQLSGITLVGKYLVVNSNFSIQSLEGLHNITAIENGYLGVRSNNHLKDLKGLRKMSIVGEEIQINSNPLIKDLKGLEKLTGVGKFFYIKQNGNLQNLEGLQSLVSVGEDFSVEKNSSLTSLDGLKKFTTIKGSLSIKENSLLTNIDGLNQLKDTIGESIYIIKNTSLKKITGLNSITDVKGALILSKNHLEEITGFQKIKTVGKSLSFSCDHLETIGGFDNLTRVEKFGIGSDRPTIDFTNSFKNLTHIKKGFFLFRNEVLEHFKGPNAVIEIYKITITDNKKLVSISGFNGLKIIEEGIRIEDNTVLKIIEGFNSLETIKKRFDIEDNPELESVKGFENIDYIEYLWVDDNYKLSDVSGFSNLKSADDIYIRNNKGIQDLTGFKNLQRVNEEFDIHNCSKLTSLNGLENLMFVGEQIDITGNKKLIDYGALQEDFLKTMTNKQLSFSNNRYRPNMNQLLIHDKLDKKVIPESYLNPKNRWWLSLLRNEVFARKGFVFGKEELTNHFTEQGWYIPNDSIEIVLNDIEEENIRLIKKYEKARVDYVASTMLNLKEKYKNGIQFSSNHKKYHPILEKFIQEIDVKSLIKSRDLSFSKHYDFDKNVLGIERENDDELDTISIYFDGRENHFEIHVENNYLEEDEYDTWVANEVVTFEFKVIENNAVRFVGASNYNYD